MGMIAFFAGLIIGVLAGLIILSLFPFSLAREGGTQADGLRKSALEP